MPRLHFKKLNYLQPLKDCGCCGFYYRFFFVCSFRSSRMVCLQLAGRLFKGKIPKISDNFLLSIDFIVIVHMYQRHQESIMVKLNCMRQLTKLCTMKYDFLTYPYLSKEIVSTKTINLSKDFRLETLYTVAFCIKEIINYR